MKDSTDTANVTNLETVGNVESVESLENHHDQGETPETTKSPLRQKNKFLFRYMRHCVSKETLVDMYRYRFYQGHDSSSINAEFEEQFKFVFGMLSSKPKWCNRLEKLFNNAYPLYTSECLHNGTFAHVRYSKSNAQTSNNPTTYRTKLLTQIKVNNKLLKCIAPNTYEIDLEKGTVESTVETTRVANLEARSILNTNLHEVTLFDRPAYGVTNGWFFDSESRLPRKVSAVDLTSDLIDFELLVKFVKDLKETFSWESHEHFLNYCGYLIHPMLAHLMPGQMPLYSYHGPTKSGKNFLSEILAKLLYSNGIRATAIVKKLLTSQYELDVFLAELSGVIYIVFDEIKNASDEDLKVIDSFATSEKILYRKMREGYAQKDNLYVVSLTSVHKSFTDETEGRLVKIELTQSTPIQVQNFYERWRDQMPVLLATIVSKVNSVDYSSTTSLPIVEDRRSGFRLMSYFVKEVFGEAPSYAVTTSASDILDELCEMYEFYKLKSDKYRNRYTPKNICDYLTLNRRNGYNKGKVINEISTALGYTSTRLNPNFKDTGYPSEAGKHYHIRLAKEKNGTNPPRYFVYVDPIISNEKSYATDLEYVNDILNLSSETILDPVNAITPEKDDSYFDSVSLMAREVFNNATTELHK